MGESVIPSAATVPAFRPGDIVYEEPGIIDSSPGDRLATYDTAGVVVRGDDGNLYVVWLRGPVVRVGQSCYLTPLGRKHHATQLDAVAAAARKNVVYCESILKVCRTLLESIELAKQEGM